MDFDVVAENITDIEDSGEGQGKETERPPDCRC